MKITFTEAKSKLEKLYQTTGASKADIDTMVEMVVDLDLRQNTFSGLAEAEWGLQELKQSRGKKHKVVVDKPGIVLIDGQGKAARLVGQEMIKFVCRRAQENGIALVGLYNSTYHSAMEYYVRKIAEQDLIGIASANGGPQGVVPYGGTQSITGTNPLAYGIPSADQPIVFDGATAKYAYGSIKLARERNKKLPEHSYFDKNGRLTTDPEKAHAIVPFGEHKGYAINIMLEVLTGSLVRARMGLNQTGDESQLGSLMIAIDPSSFQPLQEFKKQVSQLIHEIQAVKPHTGFEAVYVPGYRSEEIKQKSLAENFIEIDEVDWGKFLKVCSEQGLS